MLFEPYRPEDAHEVRHRNRAHIHRSKSGVSVGLQTRCPLGRVLLVFPVVAMVRDVLASGLSEADCPLSPRSRRAPFGVSRLDRVHTLNQEPSGLKRCVPRL